MEPKEFITVSMEKFKWDSIVEYFQLHNPIDYVVKKVTIKDDLFDDDATYHTLKKDRDKAIKAFEEYQFRVRHNIKK